MDRFLENAILQRDWEDCYKKDYCPYYMSFDEDEEDSEE